jgi:hypothetical protein
MSLVEQSAQLNPNSRSHTNLVKSGGDSPAVQYIIDPDLPGMFEYQYAANRRFSKVVIPKGSIVATGPAVKDYETLKYRNIVTFADGTTKKLPIGVAPYSYFRRFNNDGTIAHDRFGGDDFQPGIITRDFIEVPYLPNPADVFNYTVGTVSSMKFMWGAATNIDVASLGTDAALQVGDYVKPGPYGKFVKCLDADDSRLRVGQVLELDTDMPPLGWLKYVEPVYEGTDSERENNPVEPAPEDGSMVYDADYKWPLTQDYRSPGAWKTIGGGFPGLTDGADAAKTTRIQNFTLKAGDTSLTCILDPVATIDEDTVGVSLDGLALTVSGANKFAYDEDSQTVTVTAETSATDRVVQVIYKVVASSLIGMPASWNYAGSVGVARILLKL